MIWFILAFKRKSKKKKTKEDNNKE